MDKIGLFIALLLSKLSLFIIRLTGQGKGTSLPGGIALRICPSIIKLGALRVNRGIILVTGTNGKTSTNNMIATILEGSGFSVLINREGANLINGVATVFSKELDLLGMRTFDFACLEVDEAAFPTVLPQVKATCVVVTNFFRDQLDRFGELDKTVTMVRDAIKETEKTALVLNADDPLVAQLARSTGQPTTYYGLAKHEGSQITGSSAREGKYCPFCGKELTYQYYQYSQLGQYSCMDCGFSRPVPDIEGVSPVLEGNLVGCKVESSGKLEINLAIPVYGIYNLYNGLAAFSVAVLLGLDGEKSARLLMNYKPATGRMEVFQYRDKSVFLNLVKNPTGFNEGIGALLDISEQQTNVMIAINDNDADGKDISWLWDVDFELLEEKQYKFSSFICSGQRAEEMALRLKYAGISGSKLIIVKDYTEALEKVLNGQGLKSYILATYTALWPVERILSGYAQRVQAQTKDLPHVSGTAESLR